MAATSGALRGPGPAVLADAIPASRARDVLLVLGYAGLIGLSAQLAVQLPFTPVPITGQTFAVLLGAAALGRWRALAGTVCYVGLGLLGVPWFAAHTGGWSIITAPTFGYLVGFVVAAAVVGRLAERGLDRTPFRTAVTMAVGNIVIYLFGLGWLMVSLQVGLAVGFRLGVAPFIPGDILKIVLAAGLLPGAWRYVHRHGG